VNAKKPSKKPAVITTGALALAVAVIAQHEGYIPATYSDPIGIPTSCYGHVGPESTPGRKFTQAECQRLLSLDVRVAVDHVNRCINIPLTDNQMAALVSATYNIGPNIVCNSTLGRLANQGQPKAVWCAQLDRWVYAGKKKLNGLVRRRAEERKLCES
jgi:lysozyme